MKYPEKQRLVFESFLKTLLPVIPSLKNANRHTLHFICFQQFAKGHEHSKLFCTEGGGLKKQINLTETEKINAIPLMENIDFDFELYPNGCNDNHVATMLNYTFKNLGL